VGWLQFACVDGLGLSRKTVMIGLGPVTQTIEARRVTVLPQTRAGSGLQSHHGTRPKPSERSDT
jgi:hypothetical protein